MTISAFKMAVDSFDILQVSGVQNDYMDFSVQSDALRENLYSYTVFVEGVISVSRLSGIGGGITVRNAGESTFDYTPGETLHSGVIRYSITSPSAKFYCISSPKAAKVKIAGSVLVTNPGPAQNLLVPVGKWLFVAKGSVTLAGRQYDAPSLIRVGSADKTFSVAPSSMVVTLTKV